MIKRLATVFAGLLLVACGGNLRSGEWALYDFGNLPGGGAGSPLPIAALDVQAASWLAGPSMNYRLAYAEPLRRQSYTESRWSAPPAELLETFLKRRTVFAQKTFTGTGCRLQLVLDEFEQRFDDPVSSSAVLEVRALLTPLRGAEVLAKRAFLIQQPAAAPTARGGVAATREAVQLLAADLGLWLDDVVRETPVVVERCRT